MAEIVDPFEGVYAAGLACARSLEIGDIDEFHDSRNRITDLARTTQAPGDLWSDLAFQTLSAMLIGDLPLAEQKANDAYQAVSNTGFAQALGIYGMHMFSIRREQGRLGEVAPLVKRFINENPEGSVWKPGLMLIANELGFHAQARQHFEAFAATGFDLPGDVKRAATLTYFAEVCAVLGNAEHAARLSELLDPYQDIVMLMPPHSMCCGATSHFLGMLSATMKDWSAAEKHFNKALALNEQIRAWPRLAWTRLEYARMLLARGRNSDTVIARELRALAVSEAERLGLGALLHRDATFEWGDQCRVT
jgi:tetratricopeptide (TPR) repeat protein